MYLDAAASAKAIDGAATERMRSLLQQPLGNPSSAHREGQRARRVLREAREEAAAALGADPDEVVFTSGVTESLFLAVAGLAVGRSVNVCAYEHAAMLEATRGLDVYPFGLDAQGQPDRPLVGLVCVSLVNHETGLLTDVGSLGGQVILDAAQGRAQAKAAWACPNVVAMALSSHKIGGPSGVGALLVRKGSPFVSTLKGGHQEHELRAGTESVIAIAGFARALSREPRDLSAVSQAFEKAVAGMGTIIGADRMRAPGISAVRITGVPARALVELLDSKGISISAGAACASQKNEASSITQALGLSRERGLEVFRVSFGHDATVIEAHDAAAAIIAAAREIRGEAHAA